MVPARRPLAVPPLPVRSSRAPCSAWHLPVHTLRHPLPLRRRWAARPPARPLPRRQPNRSVRSPLRRRCTRPCLLQVRSIRSAAPWSPIRLVSASILTELEVILTELLLNSRATELLPNSQVLAVRRRAAASARPPSLLLSLAFRLRRQVGLDHRPDRVASAHRRPRRVVMALRHLKVVSALRLPRVVTVLHRRRADSEDRSPVGSVLLSRATARRPVVQVPDRSFRSRAARADPSARRATR